MIMLKSKRNKMEKLWEENYKEKKTRNLTDT